MKQHWIYKPWADVLFILLPPFLILFVIQFASPYLQIIEDRYDFWTWLLLIVLVDVAHVYASLFKTYLVPEEFQKHKRRYLVVPFVCLLVSLILCFLGLKIFWSVLAYVAVFHFIRQQYGFMRLYARQETKTKWNTWTDNLIIYNATIYPMLYWFLSGNRKFTWFMPNEFITWQNFPLLRYLHILYCAIIVLYVIRTIYIYYKHHFFNVPKNVLIIGTYLSWYFGIVYYNDDLIFTALNVVSHGIPYMALIYFKEIKSKPQKEYKLVGHLYALKGLFVYVLILAILAFTEESIWDISIWKEHLSTGNGIQSTFLLALLTSVLSVPQFTHYILDAFIWKSPKAKIVSNA